MGLFDNIRAEILEEFETFSKPTLSSQELFIGNDLAFVINEKYKESPKTGNCRENILYDMLERKRWGYRPVCPFCQCDKTYELLDQKNLKCGNIECRRDFNALNGTLLYNTKLSINVWYDIVKAYRNNNRVSSRSLAKSLSITQKTSWLILSKIKTSPFINEPDFSIIQVLLTPHSFVKNIPPPDKITLEKRQTENLTAVNILYDCVDKKQCIYSAYLILGTVYNWDTKQFCSDSGIPKCNLYRYLNGSRRLNGQSYNQLNQFIQKISAQKMQLFITPKI